MFAENTNINMIYEDIVEDERIDESEEFEYLTEDMVLSQHADKKLLTNNPSFAIAIFGKSLIE